MAGQIFHEWNGTVLTITSDSGTSSADLKGDTGCRGPQGRAGVIVNADGTVDMSGYATETYVDEQITRVNTGGSIDLSNYATKQYVDDKVAEGGGGTAESIAWDKVTGKPTFATVATSGSYNDLTDKPTIPQAYTLPEASSTTLGGVKVGSGLSITNGVLSATGSTVADSIDWSKVQNKPSFASVATSGDYNDLTNKPTIPQEYTLPAASESALGGIKVGSGLSITSDGVLSATGSSSGGAVDLSNYYTKSEVDIAVISLQNSIDNIEIPTTDLSNYYTKTETDNTFALKTTVPTKVSDLSNDSGYQTAEQVATQVAAVLPEVTTADNGKIMGVVDGAWALVELSNFEGVSF